MSLSGGCSTPYPSRPNQLEAERLAWGDVLRADWADPPPIEWREDRCAGERYSMVLTAEGECLRSQYDWLRDARVSWQGTYSGSDYALTLVLHRRALLSGSTSPVPLTKRDTEDIVRANEALRLAGL